MPNRQTAPEAKPLPESELYEFGPFRLDAAEGRLLRATQPIPLTPKALETLTVLVRHAGHVLTRETLLRTLWPDSVVEEANLTQHIWVLRKALEDNAEGTRYIETVPRRGYRFAAPVERVAELGPPPLRAEEGEAPHAVQRLEEQVRRQAVELAGLRVRRGWLLSAAGLLAVLLLGGGVWMARRAAKQDGGGPRLRRSVAVLGFKNLSGRSEAAWLSMALVEMLGTELAAGGQLRTVPGENVVRMKADLALSDADALAADTLARIHAQIGADVVVLGSYLESGGAIRLDLRLQETRTGETLASVAETGTDKQVLDLVSRAGVRLRSSLGLTEVSVAELRAALPSNARAARFYSEGLARLRVFDALASKDLLQKAVDADPEHPMLRSALAEAWAALGYDSKAREESQKALQLAARLGPEERLLVEGRYREAAHEWDQAIAAYHALWALAPDQIDFGLRLAQAQVDAARGAEALETVRTLRRLPSPARDDPRVDLVQAAAAETISDFRSARDLAQRAAQKGGTLGARTLVARARFQEGKALRMLGELAAASQAAEDARAAFQEIQDPNGVGRALNLRGNVLSRLGQLADAKRLYEQSLAMARDTGSQRGQAVALNNIALVLQEQGDLAGALAMFEDSLALNRAMGDRLGEAIKLNNLGNVFLQQGELAEARRYYEDSLTIARQTGNKLSTANALNNLALVRSEQGDLPGAQAMYEQSLAVAREIGDRPGISAGLSNIASVKFDRGDFAGARPLYQESLAIDRALKAPLDEAIDLNNLAGLAAVQGDLDGATQFYDQSLALNRKVGSKSGVAQSLHGLGDVAATRGDFAKARQHLQEALAIRRGLGEEGEVAGVRLALAELTLEEGRAPQAEAELGATLEQFRRQKRPAYEAQALALLARARLEQGRLAEARKAAEGAAGLTATIHSLRPRLLVELEMARVAAASGRGGEATRALDRLATEARSVGFVTLELEARLALGEIEARSGVGTARLLALRQEAQSRGFGLIAGKAQAASSVELRRVDSP